LKQQAKDNWVLFPRSKTHSSCCP